MRHFLILLLLLLAVPLTKAEEVYGSELEGFKYPWPELRFYFTSQRQSVQMAYLELMPEKPNGRTAVLLHGKIFAALRGRGLFVFCNSRAIG